MTVKLSEIILQTAFFVSHFF